MAQNSILIGYGNMADAATLSGGSWSVGLPLSNLQSREPGSLARSSNLLLASTRFDIDLGAEVNLKVLALSNHNLSLTARLRLTGGDSAGFSVPVYDTGWQDVWPSLWTPEELEWEADNFWDGKFTASDIAAWTPSTKAIYLDGAYARYWRVEIDDTANSDGYVQAQRLFLTDKWQPGNNFSYGAALGFESRTTVEESKGGAEYFDRQQGVRTFTFDLRAMTDDEAFGRALDLQRRMDVHGEVLVIPDPNDQLHALRRVFLGRLKALNPLEQVAHNLHSTSFSVKELL